MGTVRGLAEAADRESDRGTLRNARLTSLTGVLLLVLLAAEGATLLRLHLLIAPHIVLGLVLIPPVLLKLASTGYRFAMYYAGNPRYRAAGPPFPLLRLLAPFLVLSTVALFATGVMLLVVGPGQAEIWRRLHILAFLGWFVLMTVHVLAHLARAVSLSATDLRLTATSRTPTAAGSIVRGGLVGGSLLVGVVLTAVALQMDPGWTAWLTRLSGG
ncbi:MAG TPA: hypothetical protein VFB34_12625 [Chloroflexota bacterium]|nr:hypothetical protein [Chloroflexota bacterium]